MGNKFHNDSKASFKMAAVAGDFFNSIGVVIEMLYF